MHRIQWERGRDGEQYRVRILCRAVAVISWISSAG